MMVMETTKMKAIVKMRITTRIMMLIMMITITMMMRKMVISLCLVLEMKTHQRMRGVDLKIPLIWMLRNVKRSGKSSLRISLNLKANLLFCENNCTERGCHR